MKPRLQDVFADMTDAQANEAMHCLDEAAELYPEECSVEFITLVAKLNEQKKEIEQYEETRKANAKVVHVRLIGSGHRFPECQDVKCPITRECANHYSASDFRTGDGLQPDLQKDGDVWTCSQNANDNFGHWGATKLID